MRKWCIGFGIYFVLIALGFLALFVKYTGDRNKEIIVEIGEGKKPSENISVTVNVPKSWEDETDTGEECMGAQYDIIIDNQMRYALINWELHIILPTEVVIDSSWNGDFINNGDEIVFRAYEDRDVYRIRPGADESCGMILHTQEILELKEFVVIGHRDIRITHYIAYYILNIMLCVGIMGLVISIVVNYHTRKLRERHLQDEKLILEVMQTIAKFVDAKDAHTNGHSIRVAEYATMIARKMGMSDDEVRKMSYIGLMHDCGKMGIADNVLNKPSELTMEERKIMHMHTVYGGEILKSMTTIEGIREGALYHHERYDGKGYPEGLSGEDIPLSARIICVADAFDVMNSDRCYRKHLPMEKIIRELKENSGKQFDPEIVKHFIKILENNELKFDRE